MMAYTPYYVFILGSLLQGNPNDSITLNVEGIAKLSTNYKALQNYHYF